MTLEAFVDHHKNKHAPLFSSIPEAPEYVRRYVVSHPVIDRTFPEPPFDAITDIYFDSFKDFHQFFSSENFVKTVQPDHANFFDESKVVMLITRETTIIADMNR